MGQQRFEGTITLPPVEGQKYRACLSNLLHVELTQSHWACFPKTCVTGPGDGEIRSLVPWEELVAWSGRKRLRTHSLVSTQLGCDIALGKHTWVGQDFAEETACNVTPEG